MYQTLADDSEVMFGQQEEIAGAMEMEGSSQNRRGKETGWRTRSLTEGHDQG